MTKDLFNSTSLIEWGIAGRAIEGQTESGDSYAVCPFEEGVLVAVVDGLGHGSEAAEAARIAVETLQKHPHEAVIAIVERCHISLRKTRGVVMSLASFSSHYNMMTWVAVGNVEGVLLRVNSESQPSRETAFHVGGVVGFQLPSLRAVVVPVSPGDTLVFATDGIHPGFIDSLALAPPHILAARICDKFYKGNDDAMVLAACYKGHSQ